MPEQWENQIIRRSSHCSCGIHGSIETLASSALVGERIRTDVAEAGNNLALRKRQSQQPSISFKGVNHHTVGVNTIVHRRLFRLDDGCLGWDNRSGAKHCWAGLVVSTHQIGRKFTLGW